MTATASPLHVPVRHHKMRRLSWVTWRQQRSAYLAAGLVFGGLAIALLFSGLAIRHEFSHLGLGSCPDLSSPSCSVPLSVFQARYNGLAQFVPRFVMFVPCLLGVFVGGPLIAKELESGTFRFAWTQGRNRTEWLLAKLVLVTVPLTAAALGFSALFAWWFVPFEPLMGRMSSGQTYEITGTVFAARTLLALCLGTLVGAMVRRVVVAIAVSGALWVALIWVSIIYLRPTIEAPISVPADSSLITRAGWTTAEWLQAPDGTHIGIKSQRVADLYHQAATTGVTTDRGFESYLSQHGYVHWASYQPATRFWHFQLVESAGYLLASILIAGCTLWWIRRRVT